MNLLNLASKVATKGLALGGVLPGPHRKKKLVVAVGGLITVLLVKFGVPVEIAEALSEVFQAAAQ